MGGQPGPALTFDRTLWSIRPFFALPGFLMTGALLREEDPFTGTFIHPTFGWRGFIWMERFPEEGHHLTERGSYCQADLIGRAWGGRWQEALSLGDRRGEGWCQCLSSPSIYPGRTLPPFSGFAFPCVYPISRTHLIVGGKKGGKGVVLGQVSILSESRLNTAIRKNEVPTSLFLNIPLLLDSNSLPFTSNPVLSHSESWTLVMFL